MDPLTSAAADLAEGYGAPSCHLRGPARSALFHPPGYSLWRVVAELAPGTELDWDAHHGDEALYVVDGELEVDGRRAGPAAAVVVEAGVPTSVRATSDCRVVHFGPTDPLPPATGLWGPAGTAGRGVHVIPLEDAEEIVSGATLVEYYRDGTCPTCRLVLFSLEGEDGKAGPSHLHSEDEIIHVLDGCLSVAGLEVPAGVSIAIPAGRRYSIRKVGPSTYVNYRRDVCTYTSGTSSDPIEMVETVEGLRAAAAARAVK